MIRDLTFDELERSAHRRRLVRLVLGVTTLSTILTAGVIREVRIYDAVSDVPAAQPGEPRQGASVSPKRAIAMKAL